MAIRQRRVERSEKKNIPLPKARGGKKENKSWYILLILLTFIGSFSIAYLWHYFVQARVYTPVPLPKAVAVTQDHHEDLKRLWGSYRYNIYHIS